MMMMMTPRKFKVLKQPIFSIGFFRFVIMDDDELNSLGAYREEWNSGATLLCMSHSQWRPSFPWLKMALICFPWRGIHNVLSAYIWKSVVNAIRCLISATCKTQGHNHIFKDLNTQIIKVWFPHTHWWGVSACNAMSFPEDIIFPTPCPNTSPTHFSQSKY